MNEKMTRDTVAIIGAGPAGLATARALKVLGIPFQIFEKHVDVGGIWDRNNPGSPMYKSAHFISSKTMSGHYGYPMPAHYPDYPSNRQILDYIRSFAKKYGLYESILFSSEIKQVNFRDNSWELITASGEKKCFRWLVCASGTNWHPNRPSLKGEADFKGDIIHSVDYSSLDTLSNKRVLVVGGGNSGVDIACDAAHGAESAFISLRRGYHFVPKNIFGTPADVFAEMSSWMPIKVQQISFSLLLKLLNGNLTRLGLQKPDHKVLSSHPIMNTQLLHYLQHGDIEAKPDIDYLQDKQVYFVDGTHVEVDLIILATGYQWIIPFLDKDILTYKHHRPRAYLKIFNVRHPSLFINGYLETNGGAYKLFDHMGYLIAKAIESQLKQSPDAQKLHSIISGDEPDLSGNVTYVKSDRHSYYTNTGAYRTAMKNLCKTLNWPDLSEDFYTTISSPEEGNLQNSYGQ